MAIIFLASEIPLPAYNVSTDGLVFILESRGFDVSFCDKNIIRTFHLDYGPILKWIK